MNCRADKPSMSGRFLKPSMQSTNFMNLQTPAALIEEPRMERNIRHMQLRMESLGVRFRPHVKTSKSAAVAERQREAGAQGITVSTLKEAEQFFDAGFADILYAVSMAPNKVDRALALQRRGCRLQVVVDSMAAAQALVSGAQRQQQRFEVLIEVDVDGHRSGVAPDSRQLLEIGQFLHDSGMALLGVMTHAGSSYDCSTEAELQRVSEQERSLCVHAAQRLRAAGLPCPVVSVGSTPTALSARHLADVTEVRAGVYVFFDLVMAGVGVCRIDDVALSVLTTVIGHQRDRSWVIVDAGWMAMSRDRGTQKQAVDQGYGLVCDEAGATIDGFVLSAANQEHGIVSRRSECQAVDEDITERFPIGTRLRVLPNHACATGAQHECYHVVRDSHVLHTWPRFGGW
jgi:D-serine deaminase-like pyridoxal phosphate-dependent protein